MNELPEPDDVMIRRLLNESGVDESPELLEGLRRLRFFKAAPAPVPTGELAELLSETPVPLHQRPQRRNRGLILSFTLAAAMAVGATGVAASTGTDPRLTGGSPLQAEIREPASEQDAAAKDAEQTKLPAPDEAIPGDTNNANPPAPVPADSVPAESVPAEVSAPMDPSEVSGPDAGADGVSVPPAGAGPDPSAPGMAEDPECEDDDGNPAPSRIPGMDRAVDNRSSSGDLPRSDRTAADQNGSSGKGRVRPDEDRSTKGGTHSPKETGGKHAGGHVDGNHGGNQSAKRPGQDSSEGRGASGNP